MRKTSKTIADSSLQTYKKPSITVLPTADAEQLLFAASVEDTAMDIVNDEEEEWPVNPETDKPYSPW